MCPGLHRMRCGQEDGGGDSPPLRCPWAPSEVMHPALKPWARDMDFLYASVSSHQRASVKQIIQVECCSCSWKFWLCCENKIKNEIYIPNKALKVLIKKVYGHMLIKLDKEKYRIFTVWIGPKGPVTKTAYDNLIKIFIKTYLHKGAELILQNLYFLTFWCFSVVVLQWAIMYQSDTWLVHIHPTDFFKLTALI